MNNKVYNKETKRICPNCNSEKAIKWTKRKTENRGLIQRYKCKDCGKTFTRDEGFFRMRNHPNKITCALDLFYRGVSTRKVQEHFQAFYPHNASHKTVYKWVVKYAQMISKFTDKIKINNGNEIQLDEMEFHRKDENRGKGLCKDWFIDSIDVDTIFYNYIRKHQAIGVCPYEIATDLKLKDNNKWLELIGLSKNQ